jgi:alkylation response protein AidB-like acyl-CoA dehydrogenase
MDFSLTQEQTDVAALARQILTDGATPERLKALEAGDGPRFDPALWGHLAEAGLLGVAVPEAYGGTGLGFLELALLVQEIGRRTAPVPLFESAVLAALPISAFASEELRRATLPALVTGELIGTAALTEEEADPLAPTTRARRRGEGWVLQGRKACVPAGQIAHCMLTPATTDDGSVGVFLVDLDEAGVRRTALLSTSGEPDASIELQAVAVPDGARLAPEKDGRALVTWMLEHGNAALAMLSLGVCEEALRLTAEYTKERKQFEQPIAMFQAVVHREADAYIDTEAIRLTAWQAASRLAAGLPASAEVALAKFWAAEGGSRVVHAAQHLHGGVGVDRDYPLHRYFLYARHLELTLGGPTRQLLTIGKILADEPA